LNTKDYILTNVDNQTFDGIHWITLLKKQNKNMEVNGCRQKSGCQHSLNILFWVQQNKPMKAS